MIYLAMQDKVHQPYRRTLIPGLPEILESMNPTTQPGLLGICLSGAGPTILALATERFDEIADRIISRFAANNISCQWKLLEPAQGGSIVQEQ
jgi:homoserine kinase